MARVLISNRARNDRRGEVVAVIEDGEVWGRKETARLYEFVELPGVPAARLKDFMLPKLAWNLQSNKWDTVARREKVVSDMRTVKEATTEVEFRSKTATRTLKGS